MPLLNACEMVRRSPSPISESRAASSLESSQCWCSPARKTQLESGYRDLMPEKSEFLFKVVWICDIKYNIMLHSSFSLGEPTVSSTNKNCMNSFEILRTILLFLCWTTWVITVPPVDVLSLCMKQINLISCGLNFMTRRNGCMALLPLQFAVFSPGISFLNGLNLI